MSEAAQGALIGGAFAIGTLIVTLVYNGWSLRQQLQARLKEQETEHEERYRADLYAKRLEVHQQAYKWLMRNIEHIPGPFKIAKMPDSEREQLGRFCKEARIWWDSNCFYLDESSRREFVDFLGTAEDVASEVVEWKEVGSRYRSALRAVQEGIGMKHLDVKEPKNSVS